MNKIYIGLIFFFVVVAVAGSFLFSAPRVARSTPQPTRVAPIVTTSSAVKQEHLPIQKIYATNTWFSSAYQFPSQPLFAYPGAFKIYQRGLGVSFPQVKATPDTIYGSYDEMCFVNNGSDVKSSSVVSYGDWNVNIALNGDNGVMDISMTQGMPFTYISSKKTLSVLCQGAVVTKVEQGVIASRGESAVLFSALDGEATVKGEMEFTLSSEKELYRIVMLSANEIEDRELLSSAEWNRVVSTQVSYGMKGNVIQTKYIFESETGNPLFTTVWPHHGQVSGAETVGAKQYSSVLGKLRLAKTSGFSTDLPKPLLAKQFSKVAEVKQQKKIIELIQKDSTRMLAETAPEGVYFKGTWLGALSSLVQLADLYEVISEREKLVNRLDSELQKALGEFSYDDDKKMFIAKKAEFGNEKGNDHHFHYGYYIRSAAVLKKYKPEALASQSAVIADMVADISTESFDETRYPRLRAYSPYEGHSWADGVAGFADGNNQESTSEALNAWYALSLWGDVSANPELKARGEWLFSQELAGTRSYWFGVGNLFPSGYSHPIASLVWGGKRDFSTWFSPQPMHVFGIQFLPITPASSYLTSASNGLAIEVILRNSGPATHEWGDLYTAYLSYFNPEEAVTLLPQVKSNAGLKLDSLMYQTVYSNRSPL